MTTAGAGPRSDEPPGHGSLPGWLQATLFARRIVFVTGRLDDAVATRAAAELIALDAAGDEPIALALDCPEATLEAALALVDTLDLLRAPVHAHCRGQAGGPAVGVIAVAGRRSAAPHARFRLVRPTVALTGPPDQVAEHSRAHQTLLRRFEARLAAATGRPPDAIADDLRRGLHLDAREALAYGLIDAIGFPDGSDLRAR